MVKLKKQLLLSKIKFVYNEGVYVAVEAAGEFKPPKYDYYPMYLSDGTGRDVWYASDLQNYVSDKTEVVVDNKYFNESLKINPFDNFCTILIPLYSLYLYSRKLESPIL